MANWKLKGCPRCGGDTFIDREADGWYEHCLLCGYSRDLPGSPLLSGAAIGEEKANPGRATGSPQGSRRSQP